MGLSQDIVGKWQSVAAGDRRALLLMVGFLSLVVSYVLVLEPLVTRYQSAGQELVELQDKQSSDTRKAGLLQRREANLQQYRTQLARINRQFSVDVDTSQQAVARTLSELNYYARLSSVTVESIKPDGPVSSNTYTEIPFDLDVNGRFDDLKRFFYYIDTSPSLLVITRLALRHDDAQLTKASLQVIDVVRLEESLTAEPRQLVTEEVDRLRLVTSQGLGQKAYTRALQEGFLNSDDVVIDRIPAADPVTLERLLLADDVDAVTLTFFDLIAYWERGIPLIAVLAIGESRGYEGIVVDARSSLSTMAELGSAIVGVDDQGLLPFVLYQAMSENNLSMSEVNQQSMDALQVARDIASGTLTLGLTRDPYLSQLLELQQARLLYSTEKAVLPTIDVLAVKPQVLMRKPEVLQYLVSALLQAQQQDNTESLSANTGSVKQASSIAESRSAQTAQARFYDAHSAMDYFNSKLPAQRLAQYEQYAVNVNQRFPILSRDDIIDASLIDVFLKANHVVPDAAEDTGENDDAR